MDTNRDIEKVLADEGAEGDPANATACTENWKAAQADQTNGGYIRWDQTGIFGGACPHGIIFAVTDMRRSGEL